MKYNKQFLNHYHIGTLDFSKVMRPLILEILDDVSGKSVLDIGCGSGRYSEILALGDASVTGIDKSAEQISRANQKMLAKNEKYIRYIHGDILNHSLLFNSYDYTVLMFVLLDTPSPAAVRSIFDASFRLLKSGGKMVIGDLHPHNFDRKNDFELLTIRRGKTYFDNGAESKSTALLENGEAITFEPNYHYRLDFLLGELISTGFALKKFVEPQYMTDFPTHMFMVLEKS